MSVREPTLDRIKAFRRNHDTAPHSYGIVGATKGELPAGWDHDRYAIVLGNDTVFDAAVHHLRSWTMFDLPWVQVHGQPGQAPGDLVTFHSWQYGVWMLHACRVIYAIDTPTSVGFAYGTLAGHAVSGEELFRVHKTERGVEYSVAKFSRLNHPAARLAGPLARRLQHAFSVHSAQRMLQAVSG